MTPSAEKLLAKILETIDDELKSTKGMQEDEEQLIVRVMARVAVEQPKFQADLLEVAIRAVARLRERKDD
jgi:hypothetical protein